MTATATGILSACGIAPTILANQEVGNASNVRDPKWYGGFSASLFDKEELNVLHTIGGSEALQKRLPSGYAARCKVVGNAKWFHPDLQKEIKQTEHRESLVRICELPYAKSPYKRIVWYALSN